MGGPGAAAGVFDGIDLDWEWPGSEGNVGNIIRPEDKQNFTKLVQEFRKQLDTYGESNGKHYLLTSSLPAAPPKIDAGFEVSKIFASLDFGTAQGYDLHGAWESTTNHQSNLYTSKDDLSSPSFSVDDTVHAYLDRGAPASELVIGVPVLLPRLDRRRGDGPWLVPAFVGAGSRRLGERRQRLRGDERSPRQRLHPLLGRQGVRRLAVRRDDLLDIGRSDRDEAQGPPRAEERSRRDMFWELSGDTPDGELIEALAEGLSHGERC
jgi:hypothetical protein